MKNKLTDTLLILILIMWVITVYIKQVIHNESIKSNNELIQYLDENIKTRKENMILMNQIQIKQDKLLNYN